MMKKKAIIISVLSTLLLSGAILTAHVYADDLTTEPSADSSTQSSSLSFSKQTADSGQETSQVSDAISSVAAVKSADDSKSVFEDSHSDEVSSSSASSSPKPAVNYVSDEATTTILHTNDMHGRFLEDSSNGVIGMPKLAGIAAESRKKGTTLLLDSGDAIQGLPITNNSKGEDAVALMNATGYDAMTVGNHEFDFGLDQLKTLVKKLDFPIISSNIYVNGVRLFQASTVIDKNKNIDGDEYVVIGVTTPETSTKTHPRNVLGVTFTDPITEVNNVIAQTEAQARAQGKTYKNYIILGHLGVDTTTKEEWRGDSLAQALAKNSLLAGKNVIVLDGHSHTAKTQTYGNVTYNQTGSYLNNVGLIKLNSKEILSNALISAQDAKTVAADPNVQMMVDQIETKYKADSSTILIANSPVELNGDRMNVRVRETNLGNAVADALLDYGQTGFSHKSNLAVTNGGGLRETIAKDKPITKGDIIAVLPFGNSVAQVAATGQNIKDMFTKSLGSILQADDKGKSVLDENGQPLLEPSGGFLQIAGAKVYYDTSLELGKRILYIAILDPETKTYQPLDLTKIYYLVTNDFLAAGGDGYTMLGGSREEGPSMDSIFTDYLSRADLTQYRVINPNSRSISISSTKDSDGDGQPDYLQLIADNKATVPQKGFDSGQDKSEVITLSYSKNWRADQSLLISALHQTAPLAEKFSSYQEKQELPLTGSCNSVLVILAGLSLTSYGLYSSYRKAYGKEK